MAENEPVITLPGHTGGVLALAFSPCGRFLASGGEDGAVKLWSIPDGIEIRSLQAHEGGVLALAFDPDGDVFASSSRDKSVKIWRTSDCSTLASAAKHASPLNCLAFTSDGKSLYSGSDDATIKVFSSPKCWLESTVSPAIGAIKALALSPTGVLAIGGVELQFLETPSGRLLKDNDSYIYGIKALAFSNDGNMLAAATGMEKRLEIWDAKKLVEAGSARDSDWVNCVKFTPDGKRLVTGGMAVKVWDPVSGACLKIYEGHTDEIQGVDVSPDGKYIASASSDKTIMIWAL